MNSQTMLEILSTLSDEGVKKVVNEVLMHSNGIELPEPFASNRQFLFKLAEKFLIAGEQGIDQLTLDAWIVEIAGEPDLIAIEEVE